MPVKTLNILDKYFFLKKNLAQDLNDNYKAPWVF